MLFVNWSSRCILSGLLASLILSTIPVTAGEKAARFFHLKKPATTQPAEIEKASFEPVNTEAPVPLPAVSMTPLADPSLTVCPPENQGLRVSYRVTPYGDVMGTPLHCLNFSGDCYGVNWRTRQWDCCSLWTCCHRKDQCCALFFERQIHKICGKPVRGYIHDTSGHPLRSYFVPQPHDPEEEYVPGSDTYVPPRTVIDYANYEYHPKMSCRTEHAVLREQLPLQIPQP